MAINKKLIVFKNDSNFKKELEQGNILPSSWVVIKDTKKLYVQNTEIEGVDWNKVEELIDGKISEIDFSKYLTNEYTPNWDAEEGEEGFIKNKPIIEVENKELVYQNNFINKFGSGSMWGMCKAETQLSYEDAERILKLGDKYIVEINNKQFNCICFTQNKLDQDNYKNNVLSSDNETPYITYNKTIDFVISEESAGNPKGFDIYWNQETYGNEVELKIFHFTNGSKQLDPSYLPIVQEMGDSETSIMSQKAVTEALEQKADKSDIVNSDWDAEEGEKGFIKNKPKEWFGSQSEFDALNSYNQNTKYYILED